MEDNENRNHQFAAILNDPQRLKKWIAGTTVVLVLALIVWARYNPKEVRTPQPVQAPETAAQTPKEPQETRLVEPCNMDKVSDCSVEIFKSFLGKPYAPNTLEINGVEEKIVVNLEAFDCATLVEQGLALSIMSVQQKDKLSDLEQTLTRIRYRGGKLDGYASRLHYFTDWIQDNERKGIVKDITQSLGGELLKKPINFMTTHRNLYPNLSEQATFDLIKEVEKRLSSTGFYYIPKAKLREVEVNIEEGDIITITTNIAGLDVSHDGIAVKKGGRIHLLHASSDAQKVIISEDPLVDYLLKNKKQTGVVVCRPL